VLLCAATIMAASSTAAVDVESYSFPAFNVNTTDNLLVATNMTVATPASLLFQPERPFPEVNVSEGFLLLPGWINHWRASAGAGRPPAREASFNTSFTVQSSASPVSFVILLDRFPTFNNPVGLRGANDSATGAAVPNATADGLAAVEVGTVKSYAPESPDVGLNVTVTPNGTAAAAVWIEYDAVAHLLHVYVGAAGGEPRPSRALLDTPLSLAGQGIAQTSPFGDFVGQGTTETALVGLFAGKVRDIFVGVRDWDLTVDRLDGKKKKGTSWWVILIAVLGSVAAATAIISMVAWCLVSRRRARNMEPKL
jgi:hypothetical protein